MTSDGDKRVTKHKVGRPTLYSNALAGRICERLLEGKSLRSIAEQDDTPSLRTLCNWLVANDEFRKQYDQARQMQAELYADQIIEIAENIPLDKDEIQRARVRIDTFKWTASRLLPHRYGDRLAPVSVGDMPQLVVNINVTSKNDDDETATIDV